jgi:hypothetical protein
LKKPVTLSFYQCIEGVRRGLGFFASEWESVLKDLISITIRLTEKDSAKLHSETNIEKLEMCVQAVEIGVAICLAVSGLTTLEHKIFADKEKMQVSLVYSSPGNGPEGDRIYEFFSNYFPETERMRGSLEQSKSELAKEGIELETQVLSIDTGKIPV